LGNAEPGLSGIVGSVKGGSIIFKHILTCTLNSVVVHLLVLAARLIVTGHAVLTPLLRVLIIASFRGMS
jgi:H+-transporting ATPase